MPLTFDQIDKKIQGENRPASTFDEIDREVAANNHQQPKRTVGGTVKDIGVTAAKGVVGLGEAAVGLADIPTLGLAGRMLADATGYDPRVVHEKLEEQYSPAQQWANERVDRAEGFTGTVAEAVRNPSTIVQSAIESLPLMVGGGAIGRGVMKAAPKLAKKVGEKLAPVVGGAIGEGAVSSGITAEQIRQETGGLSPKQAAMSVAAGAGTGAITLAGGRLAQKLGFADVDTMLAGGPGRPAKLKPQDVVKNIVGGGISEGVFEELPQETQEQIWQNAATGKPLLEGTGEAAAMAMLTGGMMGAGANVASLSGDRVGGDRESVDGDVVPSAALIHNQAVLDLKSRNLPTRDLLALKNNPGLARLGIMPADIDNILDERAMELEQARFTLGGDEQGPMTRAAKQSVREQQSEIILGRDRERRERQLAADIAAFDKGYRQYQPPMPDPRAAIVEEIRKKAAEVEVDGGEQFSRELEEVEQIDPKVRKYAEQKAEEIVNADPVYAHMTEAQKRGIDLNALQKDYDKDTTKAIARKYPAIFSYNGRVKPDEFAQEKGYESLDHMIQAFMTAPSKNQLIARIARDEAANFKHYDNLMERDTAREWTGAGKPVTADITRQGKYKGAATYPAPDTDIDAMVEVISANPEAISDEDIDHWTYTSAQKAKLRAARREAMIGKTGARPGAAYAMAQQPREETGATETTTAAETGKEEGGKERDLPHLGPDELINGISREVAGDMLAAGDEEVLDHIRQGMEKHGAELMQHAIRNQALSEIAEVPKERRQEVRDRIARLQPRIDAILTGKEETAEQAKGRREFPGRTGAAGPGGRSAQDFLIRQRATGTAAAEGLEKGEFASHKPPKSETQPPLQPTGETQKARLTATEQEGDGGVKRLTYRDENGRDVGTARIMGETIGDIEVKPEFRRQGYGTEIVQDLIQRGGKSAIPVNEESRGLFEKAGFKDQGDGRYRLSSAQAEETKPQEAQDGLQEGQGKAEVAPPGSGPDEVGQPAELVDVGEIPASVAAVARRQAGPIRLQKGWHDDKTKKGSGLLHIIAQHEPEIIAAGYKDAKSFVLDVAKNYNELRRGSGAAIFLVRKNGANKIAVVKLVPAGEGGDFYNVETAFLSRNVEKRALLWRDAQSRSTVPGEQPVFAHGALDNSSEATPNAEQKASSFKEKIPTEQEEVKKPEQGPAKKGKTSGEKIEDFGEKIGGARKDTWQSITKEISDDDISALPLGKIWPKQDIDKITDTRTAAIATAIRDEIPAKPRKKYALSRWVEQVRMVRELMSHVERLGVDDFLEKVKGRPGLESLLAKIEVLQSIPREHWSRIGQVRDYPDAYYFGKNGEKIKSPVFSIEVDKRLIRGKTFAEAIEKVIGKLGKEAAGKPLAFELRLNTKTGKYFFNKKGDPLYRAVKEFDSKEEAISFRKENHDALVLAWEEIKERENIKKTDTRGKVNRPRSGADYRQGKDVTPEMFTDAFGFRGVEFGNWVSQGKGNKERQGMLNSVYDALFDLANIIGIPTRAISLNGTLGLGLGSRGTGWASAHFEPDTMVINLTKPRGAGSLAHEWFHALDNYFQRQRGEPGRTREGMYITYSPETQYRYKKDAKYTLAVRRFNELAANGGIKDKAEWERIEGVRPEVEEAFADLVTALNKSSMKERSDLITAGKSDGYWGRIIERAARAFENYVISKMQVEGYHNDYLANVVPPEKWGRDPGRYPYLLENEIGPVSEAFDNLFSTLKTRETDKGLALHEPGGTYEIQGTNNALVRDRSGDSGVQLQLFTNAEEGGKQKKFIESYPARIGTFYSDFETIENAAQAAQLLSPVAARAQEVFAAVVLDKDKRPIAVLQHSIGTPTNNQVAPGHFVGSIHNLKGADSIWIAHNHPSGRLTSSPNDQNLTKRLHNALRGTGVTLRGHIIMAPTGQATLITDIGDQEFTFNPPTGKGHAVKVTERRLRGDRLELLDEDAVTSSLSAAREALKEHSRGLNGILFLDTGHRPVRFIPATLADMQALRKGEKKGLAAKLYRFIDKRNSATAAIINMNGGTTGEQVNAGQNMANFLAQSGVSLLDIIAEGDSLADQGVVSKMRETAQVSDFVFHSRGSGRKTADFAGQLDRYAAGDLPGSDPLLVGDTPTVLRLLGADSLPVVINRSTVDKILREKHGLPLELLKQLPGQLADPIMIFDSASEPGSLVVMTELQHEGKTIVAAVHLNKKQRHHEVNRIASVYGKDSDRIFARWINNGLLRYRNKQKSRRWFQSRGLQLPKEGASRRLSNIKILSEDDLVKFSAADEQGSTGATPGQVMTELREFLGKGLDNLDRTGKLKIFRTEAEALDFIDRQVSPGGNTLFARKGKVVGAYTPNGKIVLVAENIEQGNVKFIFLHEAAHAILTEDAEFTKQRDRIISRFTSLRDKSDAIKAAYRDVPSDTPVEAVDLEALAYFLQDKGNHRHSIFRRVIAAVKSALARLGVPVDRLNLGEADFVALFTGGVKRWAGKYSAKKTRVFSDVTDEGAALSFSKQYGISVEEAKRQYNKAVEKYGPDAWAKAKKAGKTKLNERQFYQVRTTAFKEWFGEWESEHATEKNKAMAGAAEDNRQPAGADGGAKGAAQRAWRLDADTGEPRIFFHGTRDNITGFDLNHPNRKDRGWLGRGIYLSSSHEIAGVYANQKRGDHGPNVLPLYTNVRNPFVADMRLKESLRFASQEKIDEFTMELVSKGHDGVLVEYPHEPGLIEVVAFSPSSVKSAIGNTGQFSQDTDNIMFSRQQSGESFDDILGSMLGEDADILLKAVKKEKAATREEPETPAEKYSDEIDAAQIASTGLLAEKSPHRNDSSPWERMLSTFDYISRKDGATRRMFQAQMERRDRKFEYENQIFGKTMDGTGFVHYMENLQKNNRDAYEKFAKYILKTDRTGKAFSIKRGEGYIIESPGGSEMFGKEMFAETKDKSYELIQAAYNRANEKFISRQGDKYVVGDKTVSSKQVAYRLAGDRARAEGRYLKDYTIKEKERWDIRNPKGETVKTLGTERDAVVEMMLAEADWMEERGHPVEVIEATMQFRSMTNRAFDLMVEDMRRVIAEAEEMEIDIPTIRGIDESKRWVVEGKGAKQGFESKEKAESIAAELRKTGYVGLTVRRQADSEIQKEFNLKEVIALMGDLRGAYFPRQRKPGAVILKAAKGDRKIREHYDLYALDKEYVDQDTGEVSKSTTRQASSLVRKAFNTATGIIPFAETLEKRVRQLRREGYEYTIERDESVPEDVFDVANLMASINALLSESMDKAKKEKRGSFEQAAIEVNKILTANVADLFKARGYLSSRLKRAEGYWEGFETDPLKAGTQYARSMAGGFSKREAARKMTLALTGRDVSWGEWKQDKEKPTWEDYVDFVNQRKIDPGKQKNLYGEAVGFMREVLRNEEQADRIIGIIKGLTVLKFLGFRVSSAAVNLTNMAQAVPPTIAAQTGSSITAAWGAVRQAAVQYGRHLTGKSDGTAKNIFSYISRKGWDEAQFNYEAAAVLRSKAGNHMNSFMGWGMYLFGAAEKANRAMTIYAAYRQFLAQARRNGQGVNVDPTTGVDESLMEKAKHASDRAHGIYDKATAPAWTRGSMNPAKLVYVFQRFQHNYLLNMWEMIGRDQWKEATYMLISPAVLAGAGASLATPAIKMLLQAFGIGGDEPEEEFYKWAEETFGTDRIARHGLAGAFGVNLKGSLQMNSPFPTRLSEILGAPGAIFVDTARGVKHLRKGEIYKGIESLLPTGFGSMSKAIREHREGVTTGSYSPVFYGTEPLKADTMDMVMRFMSFNPSRLSGIREKQWNERKVKAKYDERRRDIYSRYKQFYLRPPEKRNGKHLAETLKMIQSYNQDVAASGMAGIPYITDNSIRAMLRRAFRPGKTERMRGRAAD